MTQVLRNYLDALLYGHDAKLTVLGLSPIASE